MKWSVQNCLKNRLIQRAALETEAFIQSILKEIGKVDIAQEAIVRDITQSEIVSTERVSLVRLIAAMQGTEGVDIASALRRGKDAIQPYLDNASEDAIMRSRQILVNLSQFNLKIEIAGLS